MPANTARNRSIVAKFLSGVSDSVIAREHRLTRQRVHQIVVEFRTRMGLVLPGLVITPCSTKGCPELMASGSAPDGELFCPNCTTKLRSQHGEKNGKSNVIATTTNR